MKFMTINDVEQYVSDALGEFASQYDTTAIAREISEWRDGELLLAIDDPDERFWDIAESHAL